MALINHQSNGTTGLRIVASLCELIGWIALSLGIILGFYFADKIIFVIPMLEGIAGLVFMYFLACFIRAIASIAEAAQLYYNINAPAEEEREEE